MLRLLRYCITSSERNSFFLLHGLITGRNEDYLHELESKPGSRPKSTQSIWWLFSTTTTPAAANRSLQWPTARLWTAIWIWTAARRAATRIWTAAWWSAVWQLSAGWLPTGSVWSASWRRPESPWPNLNGYVAQ